MRDLFYIYFVQIHPVWLMIPVAYISRVPQLWIADLQIGPTGHWTGLTRADNTYGWAWQDNTMGSDDLV